MDVSSHGKDAEVTYQKVSCCPKSWPCPHCGKRGQRKQRLARLEMAEYRRRVLEHFSGTLCVDELHLGRYTLLLATDALEDFPVAFALVDANDQDHMRRFLKNLKSWGLTPEVVEKAHFVFKNRYLIVKRRENLSESEEATLATMFACQPGLKQRRSIIRFLLLSLHQWWSNHSMGHPAVRSKTTKNRARPLLGATYAQSG